MKKNIYLPAIIYQNTHYTYTKLKTGGTCLKITLYIFVLGVLLLTRSNTRLSNSTDVSILVLTSLAPHILTNNLCQSFVRA